MPLRERVRVRVQVRCLCQLGGLLQRQGLVSQARGQVLAQALAGQALLLAQVQVRVRERAQ